MGNYTKYLHVELNELGLGRFISVTFCVLISLCLSGCEAQLNTQGIEKTLSQSIRRTDQLMTIVQRKDGSQLIAGNNGLLLSRDNASGKWLRETLSREGVNPNFIGSSGGSKIIGNLAPYLQMKKYRPLAVHLWVIFGLQAVSQPYWLAEIILTHGQKQAWARIPC